MYILVLKRFLNVIAVSLTSHLYWTQTTVKNAGGGLRFTRVEILLPSQLQSVLAHYNSHKTVCLKADGLAFMLTSSSQCVFAQLWMTILLWSFASTCLAGKIEYQAQSPDEAALVGAARNFGFVFKVTLLHLLFLYMWTMNLL